MNLANMLELVGFVLIVVFAGVVWWPAALLVAGVGLIAAANVYAQPETSSRDGRRSS